MSNNMDKIEKVLKNSLYDDLDKFFGKKNYNITHLPLIKEVVSKLEKALVSYTQLNIYRSKLILDLRDTFGIEEIEKAYEIINVLPICGIIAKIILNSEENLIIKRIKGKFDYFISLEEKEKEKLDNLLKNKKLLYISGSHLNRNFEIIIIYKLENNLENDKIKVKIEKVYTKYKA